MKKTPQISEFESFTVKLRNPERSVRAPVVVVQTPLCWAGHQRDKSFELQTRQRWFPQRQPRHRQKTASTQSAAAMTPLIV